MKLSRLAKLRLSDRIPDETTILNFRHLLEPHHLGEDANREDQQTPGSKGLQDSKGTIVDAALVSAPSSGEMNMTSHRRTIYWMATNCEFMPMPGIPALISVKSTKIAKLSGILPFGPESENDG